MTRIPFMTLVTLLAGVLAGRAALTLHLQPASASAGRGMEAVLSGALTNTSSSNVLFLNDIQAVFVDGASNALRLGSNAFFANVPGVLLPGEVYTGVVCLVAVVGSAPDGAYAGTIRVHGGVDIFANEALAGADFVVSAATIEIVAAEATASEFGVDAGSFTISRLGSTNFDLAVSYAVTGSATNGAAYETIASPVTIPAGAETIDVPIVPIANDRVDGDRTVTLTLVETGSYGIGSNRAATVTITDKPFDRWRGQKFGPAANDPPAADAADWDMDGLQNILEYALNLEPTAADVRPLPLPKIVNDHLTWSYVPNTAARDVFLIVEASTDLQQWSSADVEEIRVINPEPPERVTIRYRPAVSLSPHAFLRLRAVRIANGP